MSRTWAGGLHSGDSRPLVLATALLVGVSIGCGGNGGDFETETGTGSGSTDAFYEVEPGPLCGVLGPVKLLDLAIDEEFITRPGLSRIGDRYYITSGRGRGGVGSVGVLSAYEAWETTSTYSVGSCGETPRLIAEGLTDAPFALPPWPEVPVGCHNAGLAALDPMGEVPPTMLIPDSCVFFTGFTVVDGGVLVRSMVGDPGYNSYVFYPYVDGDVPGFLDGVSLVDWARPSIVLADELFYVGDEPGVLMRVGFDDFASTVVASSVDDFAVSAEHLLYIGAEGVILRDRKDDSEALVYDLQKGSWPYELLRLDDDFALIRDSIDEGGGRIIDLKSSLARDVETGLRIYDSAGGGRWFLESTMGQGFLLDHASGSLSDLGPVDGSITSVAGDEFVLFRKVQGDIYEVVAIPYDGGGERTIAARATPGFLRLEDGRGVTLVNVDEDLRGDLVVVDGQTLHEHWIDGPVFAFNDNSAVEGALDPMVIAYSVIDGARSGVYLMNLAAQ